MQSEHTFPTSSSSSTPTRTFKSPRLISTELVGACQKLHASPYLHWLPGRQGDMCCGPVSCVGVSIAPGLPEMSLSVPIWRVFFAMSDGVLCVLVPSLSLPVSEPLWEAQRLALQQAWLISGKLERTLRKTYLTRRRIALALSFLPTGFFGFGLPGAR